MQFPESGINIECILSCRFFENPFVLRGMEISARSKNWR